MGINEKGIEEKNCCNKKRGLKKRKKIKTLMNEWILSLKIFFKAFKLIHSEKSAKPSSSRFIFPCIFNYYANFCRQPERQMSLPLKSFKNIQRMHNVMWHSMIGILIWNFLTTFCIHSSVGRMLEVLNVANWRCSFCIETLFLIVCELKRVLLKPYKCQLIEWKTRLWSI